MQIIELNNPNFDKDKIQELLYKKVSLIGVFSKMCIHCQNMKKEWKNLKSKLKESKYNGLLLEIDSEQVNYIDNLSLSNSIKGFPSIMLFKNGKLKKDYKGNRTTNDMFNFLKPYMVLSQKTKKTKKTKKYRKTKKKIKTQFKR